MIDIDMAQREKRMVGHAKLALLHKGIGLGAGERLMSIQAGKGKI